MPNQTVLPSAFYRSLLRRPDLARFLTDPNTFPDIQSAILRQLQSGSKGGDHSPNSILSQIPAKLLACNRLDIPSREGEEHLRFSRRWSWRRLDIPSLRGSYRKETCSIRPTNAFESFNRFTEPLVFFDGSRFQVIPSHLVFYHSLT